MTLSMCDQLRRHEDVTHIFVMYVFISVALFSEKAENSVPASGLRSMEDIRRIRSVLTIKRTMKSIHLTLFLACGSSAFFLSPRRDSLPFHFSLRAVAKDGEEESSKAAHKIVICGGGIGGLSTAYDARHILNKRDEVTVVSDRPYFSFTPSNPWVAMGKRQPSDIQVDLTKVLPRHGVKFVQGKATKLEPSSNKLRLEDGTVLDYDYLIIATGPKLAFDEVPGLRQYGESVCTTPHAVEASEALDKLVQDPGPVVVGATQGASCFGPAYEYALLLQHELKQRGGKALVDACPISFVTSEPTIGHLGLNGAGDSESILTKLFEKKNIKAFANHKTARVTKDSVQVQECNDKGKVVAKKTLPSKLTMMIPPFHGHDVWKAVSGLADSKGMILVNDKEQSIKYPNIFAVGVCGRLPPPDPTPIPIGAPKTGYMIESQGTAAVKNIKSMLDHKEAHTVPTLNGLCITDFGNTGAVFVTLPQSPPRSTDLTIENPAVIAAKVGFEKYFLHKIRSGDTDPYYEKYALKLLGIERTAEEASPV